MPKEMDEWSNGQFPISCCFSLQVWLTRSRWFSYCAMASVMVQLATAMPMGSDHELARSLILSALAKFPEAGGCEFDLVQ